MSAIQRGTYRILVVDDNPDIHDDFRSIFKAELTEERGQRKYLDFLEQELFGETVVTNEAKVGSPNSLQSLFELEHAYQGLEAVEIASKANEDRVPFHVAFVDVRMPPGWNGIETVEKLWKVSPDLEVVLCTAYSDYSWEEIAHRLGPYDQYLILKKPFESMEVRQMALSLAAKYELKKQNALRLEGLEHAVRMRTQQLHSTAMNAMAASHAKSDFLRVVSHEFRTPLAAIAGYTELVVEQLQQNHSFIASGKATEAERVEDRFQTARSAAIQAQKSGEQLLDLLDGILNVIQLESGQFETNTQYVEIFPLIEDLLNTASVHASAKGLSILVEWVVPKSQVVHTDPSRFRQILGKLVENGIKFTESGRVAITLDRCPSSDNLTIDVRDTGIGIEPSSIPKLFAPLETGDASSNRKHGGLGIGLSLARGIARCLGGEVELLETKRDCGSTFRLTVPLHPIEDSKSTQCPSQPAILVHSKTMVRTSLPSLQSTLPADQTPKMVPKQFPSSSESLNSDLALPLEGRKVLLVEDGVDNQKLISHFLKKAGAQVDVVENGQLAVDYWRAMNSILTIDAILMDMQMPVLDGYQATRILRLEGCELPIIAVTAHAMTGDREKCLEAGCNEYTTKPVNRQVLVDLLRGFCLQNAVELKCDRQSNPFAPLPSVNTLSTGQFV